MVAAVVNAADSVALAPECWADNKLPRARRCQAEAANVRLNAFRSFRRKSTALSGISRLAKLEAGLTPNHAAQCLAAPVESTV